VLPRARRLAANPYAAALLLPAAHLWLFLGAPQTRLRGAVGWSRCWPGSLRRALVLVYELRALRHGPLELARMWLWRRAGGHVSLGRARWRARWPARSPLLVRVLRARRRRGGAAERAAHPRARDYAGPGLARRHGVGAAAMSRKRRALRAPRDVADRRRRAAARDAA
jgi:hypothetical protein